jgi:hypothetical protein
MVSIPHTRFIPSRKDCCLLFHRTNMIPIHEARKQVLAAYAVDRATASQVSDKLARVVNDASDLTVQRIAGAIVAVWRHCRTGYDKRLQAESRTYYDGGRQQAQDEINAVLRAKLDQLRLK